MTLFCRSLSVPSFYYCREFVVFINAFSLINVQTYKERNLIIQLQVISQIKQPCSVQSTEESLNMDQIT